MFLKTRRVGIVLDEAQKIKNPDSNVTKALFTLRKGFFKRVIMTGTPIPNRPYDIWAQIYFLDGGESLGETFDQFKKRVDLDASVRTDKRRKDEFEKALQGIWSSIEPFSIRETKISSGIQLPAKSVRYVEVDLEHRQRELYDRVRNELRTVIVEGGMPRLDEAEDVLKRLLRLVQLASNPAIIDEAYAGIPGKYRVLEEEVRAAISRREKIIVWTSFIKNVNWLARELQPLGVVRHHGEIKAEERLRAIKSFKTDPDCRVLIATPASAKEGLTLVIANNAVFYDRSFSLDDYLQAQDRIHRISQKRECSIVNIVARDTIDEWVDSLVNAKGLAAALAQGDISRDKFASEMTYGFDEILRKVLGSAKGGWTATDRRRTLPEPTQSRCAVEGPGRPRGCRSGQAAVLRVESSHLLDGAQGRQDSEPVGDSDAPVGDGARQGTHPRYPSQRRIDRTHSGSSRHPRGARGQ